ncbi:thioesterase family protein [Actinocorallia sp. B10E7]|uniref:thioesterase family protein n=1 Tax=Actinocorallia sp. B10E7 TaxID=3153558 RepID=UPI00325FC312
MTSGIRSSFRFDADTALTPAGENTWTAEVRSGWGAIGGQPNGGYLLALALGAAAEAVPGSRPYSVNAHYLRPGEVGAAELAADVVKLGRLKSTVEARLRQRGKERVRVLATLGPQTDETALAVLTVPPPRLPDPDDCVKAAPGVVGAEADMVGRFDYRVAPVSRWSTGRTSDRAVIEGWIRFADGREPDLASLPLFADAFPPAVYEVVETGLAPTVELTVHLRRRPAPGWLQVRFGTRLLAGGVLEEDGEIWDSEGHLVAMSRQLALLLPVG